MIKRFLRLSILLPAIFTMLFGTTLLAQTEYLQVDTLARKMLVFAPDDLESNRPLLLSLHGLNQDIKFQQNQTRWEALAEEHNFVVVYPAGVNNAWSLSGTRDVDFIVAIIDEMYERHKIDRSRVYLSGFSMGGMMSYHAVTHIADKIACIAPVGGYLMRGPRTNSSRTMPIIHIHGTTDDVVPFSGVQTCLDAWIVRNNCAPTPTVIKPFPANKPDSKGTLYQWSSCNDGVEIALLKLDGVGHWHSINPNGVNTSLEIWNFCKRFSIDAEKSQTENITVN